MAYIQYDLLRNLAIYYLNKKKIKHTLKCTEFSSNSHHLNDIVKKLYVICDKIIYDYSLVFDEILKRINITEDNANVVLFNIINELDAKENCGRAFVAIAFYLVVVKRYINMIDILTNIFIDILSNIPNINELLSDTTITSFFDKLNFIPNLSSIFSNLVLNGIFISVTSLISYITN